MNKFTKSNFFSTFSLLPLFFLLTAIHLQAQDFPMVDGTTITTCGGTFYDTGGVDNDYGANENVTMTICSDGVGGSSVQLYFLNPQLGPGDDICFYDGMNAVTADSIVCASTFLNEGSTSFIVQATAANPSGCLTVVFISNGSGEGSGWAASIDCTAPCQNIFAELTATNPAIVPADTGWINACQGQAVTFSAQGIYPQSGIVYNHSDFTSDFDWNFGDGTSAVGPNASHVFPEEIGYTVQLTITDQFGCKNLNFINQRVRISTTPDFDAYDLTEICVKDTIHLAGTADTIHHTDTNLSAITVESSFTPSLIEPTDTVSLPDGVEVDYVSVLNVNQFSPGQTLTDIDDLLSIFVNMEHSWLRDLGIVISCPDGTVVELHDHPGNFGVENHLGVPIDGDFPPMPGQGWDYSWTVNSTNGTWLEFCNAGGPLQLPSQDYNAFGNLADLVGCPLNGDWTMTVTDYWAGDNGFLFYWGIDFADHLFPDIELYEPEFVDFGWEITPTTIYNNHVSAIRDSIVDIPQNAGTVSYTFFVDDDFGCHYDTTITISVLPEGHPNCHDCEENVSVPNDVAICIGDTAFFDVSGNIDLENEVTFAAVPLYDIGAFNHPEGSPYLSSIDINSIGPATIITPLTQIISVCFDLETDFDSDIKVFLIAPTGEKMELTTGNGGGGDNYTQTCFTPSATIDITAGTAPFTGNFQPEGDWSDLQGAGVIGNWQLEITDALGINDVGTLNSWEITFNSINELTYTWSPPTGLSCINCPDPVAVPNVTTDYIVQSEDLLGCLNFDTITVTVVNTLQAPEVTCESVGGGNMLFSWSDIEGIASYDLQVTINNVSSPWENEVAATTYVVNGLSFGDVVSMDVMAHVSSVGCEVAVGTSSCIYNECGVNDEIIIDDVVVVDVDCFGNDTGSGSIFLSNGHEPYTFQWDDNEQQILSTASFLTAGTYHVFITDSVFCVNEVEVIIEEPAVLSLTVSGEDALCLGVADGTGTVMSSGGTTPYTYSWDNAETNQTAEALAAGLHSVEVSDDKGCQASIEVLIGEPATAVSLNVTQTLQGCFGENENEATVMPSGGTGTNFTFDWEGGQTNSTAVDLPEGEIGVSVFDENGCMAEITVILTDLDTLFGDIIIQDPSCFNLPDGVLGLNNYGGGAGQAGVEADYSFSWSSGHTGVVASNVLGGETYAVTIEDAQGCNTVISRALNNPDPVDFKVSAASALCFGSFDGTAEISSITGVQGDFNILWSPEASSQTTILATGLSIGTYWVTITDDMGCEAIESVEIEQPTEIKVDFTTIDNECFGDENGQIDVTVIGGIPTYTYEWPNQMSGTNLQSLVAGIYTLSLTDANGCLKEVPIEVEQPEALLADLEGKDVSCFGDRNGAITVSTIGGVPPFQYSLNNTDYVGSSTLIGLTAGHYNVFILDANGCMYLDQQTIEEPAEFRVDAGPDIDLNLGDSIRVWASAENGQGDISYVWYAPYDGTTDCSECHAVWLSPSNTIIYELYGEDEKGCTDTDLLTVNVLKPRLAVVPTGFTPNGDGINDILQVHGLPGTKVLMFRVFDRWGELLFEASDFEVNTGIGWDGTFRNEQMNGGVYIWNMEVEYPHDKETAIFMGETTLIK